jgi:SAM-dependent methyltransferase
MSEVRDWVAFWDSPHSIYVNARHKDVHYRDIASQIAAFVPGPTARVLDYGCGEAVHADLVAAAAGEVLLCDAAPSVRAALTQRFAANRKIRVLAPDEIASLANSSFDLVVANSVSQYLTRAELERLLAQWRGLLAPGGTLIVADVIPPDVGALTDVLALLRYAAANGFLIAALVGLLRTIISGYHRVRAKLGLSRYGESEFLEVLTAAGFRAERLACNLEHNQARMTFRARLV